MKRIVFLLALAMLLSLPVQASPQYNEGVRLFQARQYSAALKQFGEVVRTNPTDLNTHYYMGLCYQCLNQHTMARKEFEYVAYYDRGQLKQQAQAAIQLLDNYKRSSGASASAPATSQLASANLTGTPQVQGRLRVLEFVTDWCGVCKTFEPTWKSVSRKLSRVAEFRQLDGEDPSNKDMMDKFNIKGFPTIVLTDNSGQMLRKMVGAYPEDHVTREITELTGARQ